MITPKHIEIPEARLAEICRKYQVRELALFGSVVRDQFRDDSDIDLLVEFEPEARIGFIGLSQLRRELSELLGRDVDLVSKNGLNPIIRDSALSSAEIIYAIPINRRSPTHI